MDEPTPDELFNDAAKLACIPDRLDHNSGMLIRDRAYARLLLELAKRLNKPVLTLPRKK